VGVFDARVERAVLAVCLAGQHLPCCDAIAHQLIHDDHAGDICQPREPLAEALLGGHLVPVTWPETVEYAAVLIHSPPEVMALPIDGETDCSETPRVARPGVLTLQVWFPEIRNAH
jgi:hypothetical protein